MTEVVLLRKDENIAIITLNLPEKLNAVNAQLRDALYEALLVVQDDPSVDGVVLCGNGRGFCAGADLGEFGTSPTVIEKRRIRVQHDIWEELRKLNKPIAATLHGFAIGSGIEMAMICDFRFATTKTKLALPESSLGILPAAGGTQSLPRLMHLGKAMDFALKGYSLTPVEGKRLKIITDIFPEETLLEDSIAYMKRVVKHAQVAKWVKSLVANAMDYTLEQGLANEQILIRRCHQHRIRLL